MKYTIKRIGRQNVTEVTYENGAHILRSYSEPVAAYIPGLGFIETTTSFSRTTSKHVTQWKKRNNYPLVARVEQREIDEWEEKLDSLKMGEQA